MSDIAGITIKTTAEIRDAFNDLKELLEAGTSSEVLKILLDTYNHPRKIEVSKPEDLERIKNLELTYGDLRAAYEKQKEANDLLRAEKQDLLDTVDKNRLDFEEAIGRFEKEKQELNRALEERPAEVVEVEKPLLPTQLLIELHPVVLDLVNECAALESQRKKKDVSPSRFLGELFWNDVQNPSANHLPRTYSSAELRARVNRYNSQNEPA